MGDGVKSPTERSARQAGGKAPEHGQAPDDSTGTVAELAAGSAATPERSARFDGTLRVLLWLLRAGPVLILVILVLVIAWMSPVFLTTRNIGNVLAQTAVISVLAMGQLLVIVTRGSTSRSAPRWRLRPWWARWSFNRSTPASSSSSPCWVPGWLSAWSTGSCL